MNYQQTAENFAEKYGIELNILSVKYGKHFPNDKSERYIFKCQLKRNGKSYTFNFGQSIFNGGAEPELYDILASLTKYDPIDYKNFMQEFGACSIKVYHAVQDEYNNVNRLFSDIMDELREIN